MADSRSSIQSGRAAPPGTNLVLDDCWNRIGIQGDRSCPELPKHAHCRNCPVFISAGLKLLDRELTNDYREEWTRLLSEKRQETATAQHSELIFRIEKNWLALPTGLFQEVTETRPIHSLPHRRNGMLLGLANVRGELLICVSLGRILALETQATHRSRPGAHNRFMVVNWKENRFVFPVDEVRGVHRFGPEELGDAPPVPEGRSFLRGMLRLSEGPWVHRLDEANLMNEVIENLV
jgi:chemotaxis-related protein WspD